MQVYYDFSGCMCVVCVSSQIVGRQRLDLIREAMRPVLLVHVLSAQVTATAAYDAAGERTVPPEPAPAAAADDSPAAAATAPAAAQPGVPFGRLPGGSGLQPIDPTRVLMQQLPPLAKDAIVDIAVGTASLGVCTPDMAEALTGWAMSVPAGGLSRFTNRQLCSLLWAFAECRHDRLSLFEGAAEIIAARVAAAAAGGAAAGGLSGQSYARMTDKDMQKLLWAWAKFNRHPGEELLEAVRLRWSQLTASNGQDTSAGDGEAGAAAAAAGVGPALDVVCSLIYSLAVLREHRHPFMQLLCSQLGQLLGQQVQLQPAGTASAAAQQGEGEGEAGVAVVTAVAERLQSHGPQLAAAMLAAQSENQDSPLVHVLPDKLRHEVSNVHTEMRCRHMSPSSRALFIFYVFGPLCLADCECMATKGTNQGSSALWLRSVPEEGRHKHGLAGEDMQHNAHAWAQLQPHTKKSSPYASVYERVAHSQMSVQQSRQTKTRRMSSHMASQVSKTMLDESFV